MSNVAARVKELIAKQLGIDQAKVTDEARFGADLNADSLDTVEVMMTLEEEFSIEISEEQAEKIVTVGDAIRYIESVANN